MKKKAQSIAEWGVVVALISVFSMYVLFIMGDKLKELQQRIGIALNQSDQVSNTTLSPTPSAGSAHTPVSSPCPP
ncbi:MAG: hypothetical protein WCG23_01125 [bacterium]